MATDRRKALVFAAGLLLPFVAGEVVLQTWDPYHFGQKEEWTRYYQQTIDPETGRPKPGATGTYLGKRTVINPQGWRSPEFEPKKPEGVFRVLVLGGSVPYGWGVGQGEEYPRVLEGMLNRAGLAGDRRIEVVNAGVPGLKAQDIWGQDGLYETTARAWQADLVIWTLVATDVPTERPTLKPRRAPLFDESIRRLRLARAFENRYMFNTPGAKAKSYDAYDHLSESGLSMLSSVLPAIQAMVAAGGSRLVVFDTLGRESIRKRCSELGIRRVDGYTSWALRQSWEVSATDAHPNAEGHRFLADLLLRGISDPALWRAR